MRWLQFLRRLPQAANAPREVAELSPCKNRRDLAITVMKDLTVPTPELVKKTGYDPATLCKAGILPQPYREGYQVVVSALSSVNIPAFESLGIPVSVASARKIDEVWCKYKESAPQDTEQERLFKVYRDYTGSNVPAPNH